MSKYLMHKLLICIIILLGITITPAFAQEEDEEYQELPEGKPSAYWIISIDAQGKASSNLSITVIKGVPDIKAIQDDIAIGLQEALRCTIENVKVRSTKYTLDHSANCRLSVQKSDLVSRVVIKSGALLNRLQQAGLSIVNVSLTVPKLAYNRAPEGSKEFSYDQTINYSYPYNSHQQAINDISFEFGYSGSYLTWLTSTFSVILISPVLLILFIRAKTLKLAVRDAAAAWFGYWRVHRWIAEGIWVVWLISINVFHIETFIDFINGEYSPAMHAAVYFLPPGIVSFLCQYLTRPLWSKVRGVTWNKKEMLINGFWQHVAAVLPMVFIVIGIGSMAQHGAKAIFWFGAAVAAKLLGAWKYGKATKTLPNALHGGELKEKILDMAQRAGVKIQQVFLMPASQLQMGNAFAMKGERVMITDYLLERLTRQETDCVMAHEIGHVKKRHVLLLSVPGFIVIFIIMNIAARIALTIIPSFFISNSGVTGFKAIQSIEEYLLYPVSLISALLFRYLLSRRFERSADEFAVLLTNDPENMITGLVKLSKMNLMPLGWGRLDEGLSTHPSTSRRIEAVAKDHGVSRERLRHLLAVEPRREEGTGYSFDEASVNPNLVFSSEKKTKTSLVIALIVLFTLSFPPLLLAKIINACNLPPFAYAAGILLMPLTFILVAAFASLMGYEDLKKKLYEKISRKGVRPHGQFHFIGIVPEQFPRAYDNDNVWDVGFMGFASGALVYYGDKATFGIPRENVVSIARGQSSPGWFNIPEIYVTWTDGDKERIFHFHSLKGRSMPALAKQSGLLLPDLLAWHRGTGRVSRSTNVEVPGLPAFPDVKGRHPSHSANVKGFIGSLLLAGCASFGFAAFLHLDDFAAWYGIGMAAWCLLIWNFPLWRYRDNAGAASKMQDIPARNQADNGTSEFARVEKERKINQRLAVGVGVLGIGTFAALYVLFIFMMSSGSGFLFKLLPSPAYSKAIQSDGERIYQFSHKFDMSTFDPQVNKKAEDRHFAAVLEGTRLSDDREIPPFVTAAGSDKSIVLFGDGFYANYDGVSSSEVKTEGIGKWPTGIATPGGLFVISSFKDGMKLTNIQGSSFTVIPFPDGVLSGEDTGQLIEPVWYGDQLGLFWTGKKTISWTLWSGTSWSPAVTQPFSGYFKVIGDDKTLHFFHEERSKAGLTISQYVFENNAWQAPLPLPIPDNVTDWNVFLHHRTPMMFIRQGSTETLYAIDKGRLVNPVLLKAGASPFSKLGNFVLAAVVANLMIAIIVYVVSVIIGKYKKQSSRRDAHYEFASLFRRFLANVINAALILLLPIIIIWFSSKGPDAVQKSFLVRSPILWTITLYAICGFLYHSLCEGLFGATAGKKACGIKVLKNDFTPAGIGAGFLRNALRIIDSFLFYVIGATAVSGTVKWQRLGDMMAETVVVRNE